MNSSISSINQDANTAQLFNRILIANRGEIACRIIQTCHRLGIETVAIYSEADADARHCRMADHAIAIGPAAAADSYLNIERVIGAAQSGSAQAIHPGYGFLAENAEFAQAVAAAGLVLIGPKPETIEAMGSKARAKAIMQKADVPLVPGYHGDDQSDETLRAEAEIVGFPLMLKAAAGGGGKGMRVVSDVKEFEHALAAARREAQSAFGDERMILERYIQSPKHIEAQIFGDQHGQVVHLFERDCSSQRRHQKVIEEAPAAGLDTQVREKLLTAAVNAAKAVDYIGAGTVEFLVEGEQFYFLEMNTRLQVEHPVTEAVTGQDLVEWQLRVAAGQPLPCSQDQIECNGHAMEARIYAEDADAGFLPDSGTLTQLQFPLDNDVRVDTGVDDGDRVSVHYDPMIAKLIVHSDDRIRCLAHLKSALAHCHIAGLTSNLGFLLQLAARTEFEQARIDTGLLDRSLDEILDSNADVPVEVIAAAAYAFIADSIPPAIDRPFASIWDLHDGWRIGKAAPQRLELEILGQRIVLECLWQDNELRFEYQQQSFYVRLDPIAGPDRSLQLNDRKHRLIVHHHDPARLDVVWNQRRWSVQRHRRFEAIESSGEGSGCILAPMPGKVIQLAVQPDQTVAQGQTVALIEAMKMELSIKAEVDGTVKTIAVTEGELIEAETLMIEIEPE